MKKRSTLPVEVKQTAPPTICPVCGSKTERLGGDFWQCESRSCDWKNESLRRWEQKQSEDPQMAELLKRITDGLSFEHPELNRTLEKIGIPYKFRSGQGLQYDLKKLGALANRYLQMSDEEFRKLTPDEFNDLLEVEYLLRKPQPPPTSPIQQKPTESDIVKIHKQFKAGHRRQIAIAIVSHLDSHLSDEVICDLLDEAGFKTVEPFRDWNHFLREGNRRVHDMVTDVRDGLRKIGLLSPVQ